MTDAAVAKLVMVILIRLFPQCYTTVEVGDVWETRPRPAAIYEMGRDNALAERVIQWRSPRHPRARVISAMCVK